MALCLDGKTACQVYHDPELRRRILRLLEAKFCRNVRLMAAEDQHDMAWARQAMRLTVDASPIRKTCEYAVGPNNE